MKTVVLLLPSLNEEQNSTCSGCWKCPLSWHIPCKADGSQLCLVFSFSGRAVEVRWLLLTTFYNSSLSVGSTWAQPNIQWLHWIHTLGIKEVPGPSGLFGTCFASFPVELPVCLVRENQHLGIGSQDCCLPPLVQRCSWVPGLYAAILTRTQVYFSVFHFSMVLKSIGSFVLFKPATCEDTMQLLYAHTSLEEWRSWRS